MATLLCFLWWILLGALLGWLASWLLGKSLSGPTPAPIERIVERPVDRIVEKPVEKVVDKLVDNPAHLKRISALEGEVAVIAGLRKQIADLQAAPPKVVEKIVEKPVEKAGEGRPVTGPWFLVPGSWLSLVLSAEDRKNQEPRTKNRADVVQDRASRPAPGSSRHRARCG